MTAVATPDAARLVFAAVAGLILLLILIIKFKVHAMISILVGAVGIGLMAGMPLSDIVGSVNEGIGNTLKGIALLVGLGSMFGAILEESGGAQTLAVTMVRKFGDEKAAWALGITGLVVAGVFHASPKTKTGALESKAGWKGLIRKGETLLIVLVACQLDAVIGGSFVRDAAIIGFSANEAISIVENAGLMGLPIPATITKAIDILKQRAETPEKGKD